MTKVQKLIKETKEEFEKIEALTPEERKKKNRLGTPKEEIILNGIAFRILIGLNENKPAEERREIIEELEDYMNVY